jgi:hypothetical protein
MVGRPKIERCEICLVDKAQNFPHHCYIQPIGHSPLKDVRYIFYDIEATQTDRISVNGLKVDFWENLKKNRPIKVLAA